ncbi:uracil-DNA glycosylase [Anabrus simplex]|uniref:uracil-DNA glycosylase n=1 Tax=Anabrus simplex TaxID=316456 RepID=UPI0035A33842
MAQKSILDFVKRATVKRGLAENVDRSTEAQIKKPKTEKTDLTNCDENTTPCAEETVVKSQLKPVIDQKREWPNQIIAKIKLTCKKFPALHPSIGHSWFKALEPEFKEPYFFQLSQFLVEERRRSTVFPREEEVWTWTRLCSVSDVKVVILGQDPYHNPGQAHGLCFSVPRGVDPPPSLLNIYKELEDDIPGFKRPSHGNLTGWAEQGVLLLNAVLTVKSHSANSHKDKGWEQLTDAVIKYLSKNHSGIVFLLWGSYAQKKAAVVDVKKHHLLKSAHPSPLSAHRGFFGCKHFSQCNKHLESDGKTPINWAHLPPSD